MNHLVDKRGIYCRFAEVKARRLTLATSGRVTWVVIGPYLLRDFLFLPVRVSPDNHLVLVVRPMTETFSREFCVHLEDHVNADVAAGE